MKRVAILLDSFPSYSSKCIETLANQDNVQVLAYCRSEGAFPNVLGQLEKYPNIYSPGKGNPDRIFDELYKFRPHLAVITITRRGLYANIASAWGKCDSLVVGACDHLWKGDWRNYANLLAAKLGYFSQYEAILVCGALGKIYAKKIGFGEQAIFDGLYTCEIDVFQPIGLNRHTEQANNNWPKVFLFVGQYIHRKGFDILLKAYQAYRHQASSPWELWLVGSGDMEKDIGNIPGVRNLGEKSSYQIAEIMRQSGCFVLPSRIDHWGVVIHEAANAGLPILASNMCGASVELVQSGFNGYVFPINDVDRLVKLFLVMNEGGLAHEMGKNSLHLARRFSPELWVRTILHDIPLLLRGKPLVS
jgi:glycosyltransferase involved in cell wall biosynthesis